MQKTRVALCAGIAIAAVLLVSACSTSVVHSASSPSPRPTPVDKSAYLGHELNPVDTTWAGTDSGGDLTSFTLHDDHTLAVSYATHVFDYPGDTWAVNDGVLTLHVFINHSDGTLDYTGQYDPATKTIAATATTSLTAKAITVTLSEK
jgi:hypothetical protein